VTASDSEQGAIQMRDLVVDKENGIAKVQGSCILMDRLKSELRQDKWDIQKIQRKSTLMSVVSFPDYLVRVV
jgi:hypothetical protein